MSFTKGPWYADDFEIYSEADPANLLAHVYAVDRPDEPDGQWMAGDETRANMRLIKSAPELLDALDKLLGKAYKQNWNDQYPELLAQVESVIAKARA